MSERDDDTTNSPAARVRDRSLGSRASGLEIDVGERVFADPQGAWWQRQLAALVASIEVLHEPQTGLASDSLAEPSGRGVTKRARTTRVKCTLGAKLATLSFSVRKVHGLLPAMRLRIPIPSREAKGFTQPGSVAIIPSLVDRHGTTTAVAGH